MLSTEERVQVLEITSAVQANQIQSFGEALNRNTAAMETLTASLNKSKGGIWVLGAILTVITAIGGYLGLHR